MDTTAASGPPLFRLFWTYLWRWGLLGLIGGALTPVVGPEATDNFWSAKLLQALSGLPFGIACALVFTPLQNYVNPARKRPLSWATVIGVWMGMKFVFAYALGAFS